MTRHQPREKTTDRKKKTQKRRAPQQTASESWSQHEHVASSVQDQAQKLLDEAGSPELAKHAVDQAAHSTAKNARSEPT